MSQDASVVETVAKYFYFSCLDEQVSFAASLKVMNFLSSRNLRDSQHRAEWVKALHLAKTKLSHVRPKTWSGTPGQRGFTPSAEVSMNVWSSFLSTAEPSEVEAVLLSRILGFLDLEIAEGLEVTEGTVRYRVGRGLRHLGGYIES